MSFFDRQGIPGSVLKGNEPTRDSRPVSDRQAGSNGTGSDGSAGGTDSKSDGESDGDAADIGGVFKDDVAMLRDYCLITFHPAFNLSIKHLRSNKR